MTPMRPNLNYTTSNWFVGLFLDHVIDGKEDDKDQYSNGTMAGLSLVPQSAGSVFGFTSEHSPHHHGAIKDKGLIFYCYYSIYDYMILSLFFSSVHDFCTDDNNRY